MLAGVVLSGILWFVSLAIVQDLIARDPLIQSDLRIANFLETFRSPRLNDVMLLLTDLGSWQVITAASFAFGALLFYLRRRWWVYALITSMIGELVLSQGLKHLFHRMRPDLSTSLVTASGGSFPSGHTLAGATLYGFIACYVISHSRSWLVRAVAFLLAAALILGIAFSRVYLGVHWPSDLIGALVLGPAWLSTVFLAFNSRWVSIGAVESDRAATWEVALVFVVWVGAMAAVYEWANPLVIRPPNAPPPVMLAGSDFVSRVFDSIPRFTEDVTGARIEPVNVILIGSERDIVQSLAAAGWQKGDNLTVGSTLELVWAELRNLPDPDAPGAPSFLNGVPNTFSFEKATASSSVRERHHLHLWQTPIRKDGVEVWAGSVHLDTVGKLYGLLSYHKIDPDIDAQRRELAGDLAKAACAKVNANVKASEPMRGANLLHNVFFTDGLALEITATCPGESSP